MRGSALALLLCLPVASAAASIAPGFTVIPPGPVTDRIAAELRLAVRNPSGLERDVEAVFFWDRADGRPVIGRETQRVAPHSWALLRCWAPCAGHTGDRTLIAQATWAGHTEELRWPLKVVASDTPALPRFGAMWLDPLGLSSGVYPRQGPVTAGDVRDMVDAMARVGVTTAIITYVEFQGWFFYPSAIRFYDHDVRRESGVQLFDFDVVEAVLSQADRNAMHVFLGLGRSGDTQLLAELDRPDWPARKDAAVATSTCVAADLWRRYRHHPSLYGWYLTHEMTDLARSSAYYDPVADFCHALSPDKPVMVAPDGTPILTPETLRASPVDIFACQDAVGAGYVPGKYTYKPENRLAMLDTIYAQYRRWSEGTGKHLWADLEVWEMDGTQGYSGAYPPPFGRVQRQLETEAKYVEFITAYEYSGFMQDPKARVKLKDPRAQKLCQDYQAYLR